MALGNNALPQEVAFHHLSEYPMSLVTAALNDRWNLINAGDSLTTPSGESTFTVTEVSADEISINAGHGSPIKLRRAAFVAGLQYLVDHAHVAVRKCEIRSNMIYKDAGLLCKTVRDANSASGGTMVITYVLPILQRMRLVDIDSKKPNRVWLT